MSSSARREPSTVDPPRCAQAQTATIGLILVFGMVIAGAVIVVMFGSMAIDDTQNRLSEQRAQKTMTQFDSKSALVALQNADTQQIQFPRRGKEKVTVDDTAGELTIDIESLSGGTDRDKTWELGKMTYTSDGMELAYQGGGVWRKVQDSRESVMISPPEFHFRNGTLTLPIITVEGDDSIGTSASVSGGSAPDTWHPDVSAGWSNPLDDHKVTVTVKSEYYKGWGQYFETRTDGEVTYDHPDNEVTLELLTPIGNRRVRAASTSLAPTGSFTVTGTSGHPCSGGLGPASNRPYADSYDSEGTTDNYCEQKDDGDTGARGNITYGDSVDISMGSGGSAIKGSVRSGGSVSVSNSMGAGQPFVDGDIFYTTTCNGRCNARSTGSVEKISGVRDVSDISRHVRVTVDDLETDNDNADTGGTIVSDSIQYTGSTATLSSGTYFLDRIEVPGGNTIHADASTGPITIAVKDFMDVQGTFKVTGDNKVEIYIKGENAVSGKHLRVTGGGHLHVVNDDAPELRIFGQEDLQAIISGSDSEMTGVIYAPPGPSGSSDLHIDHGALLGGAVVADTTIGTQGSIHYDEALENKQIVSRNAKVITITYLHISENEIDISG